MTEATRAAWQAALLGTVVSGTVTDEITGDTLAYSWVVDNVLWDGFSDRLRVVLNNGDGAYREFCFDGSEGTAAAIETMDAGLAAQAQATLESERFADLAGEVL
jgi:hypothetical protein